MVKRGSLTDVQARPDTRRVDLQRVGVKGVRLPYTLLQRDGGKQMVQARIALSVDLPHRFKGTHMSRFIEILERWKDEPTSSGLLEHILSDVRRRLDAASAHIVVTFTYFMSKRAPVSRQPSTMGYDCRLAATLDERGYDLTLGLRVPITTLCPCSKAISEAGAHNQRGWLRVNVRTRPGTFIWIEDLVRRLEPLGSCDVYPLLKRSDEKYVTERAFHNPKFVEDVLRDVVLELRADPIVTWFEVECEADESIHPHNVFAYQVEGASAAAAT